MAPSSPTRYDELLVIGDTPVVRLGRAVAVAELDGPEAGLAALAGVALQDHRLPAARAELLARLGDHSGARASYDAAIALCANDAERDHLVRRRAMLPLAPGGALHDVEAELPEQ